MPNTRIEKIDKMRTVLRNKLEAGKLNKEDLLIETASIVGEMFFLICEQQDEIDYLKKVTGTAD
jgi:hypothetical protein